MMPPAFGHKSGSHGSYVANALDMARRGAVCSLIVHGSYGFHDIKDRRGRTYQPRELFQFTRLYYFSMQVS